jgi:hypothetical protein
LGTKAEERYGIAINPATGNLSLTLRNELATFLKTSFSGEDDLTELK